MQEKQLKVANELIDYFVNNLRVPREAINSDTQLFGEGIGLDSVDSLEVIAGIDQIFGVSVFNIENKHFQTIGTLSLYIAEQLEVME